MVISRRAIVILFATAQSRLIEFFTAYEITRFGLVFLILLLLLI